MPYDDKSDNVVAFGGGKTGGNSLAAREDRTAMAVEGGMAQMITVMQGIASAMKTTADRLAALERQVAVLTHVTPAQAKELNAAIRARAATLCGQYRLPGRDVQVAGAIRRDIRVEAGVSGVRELPRCEYKVWMAYVGLWDNRKVLKGMRA